MWALKLWAALVVICVLWACVIGAIVTLAGIHWLLPGVGLYLLVVILLLFALEML